MSIALKYTNIWILDTSGMSVKFVDIEYYVVPSPNRFELFRIHTFSDEKKEVFENSLIRGKITFPVISKLQLYFLNVNLFAYKNNDKLNRLIAYSGADFNFCEINENVRFDLNSLAIVTEHDDNLMFRKYSPRCQPEPEELYPVLVTCMGGCGSHSIATNLQRYGMNLVHESSWLYAVNDIFSGQPYPYHNALKHHSLYSPRFSHVIQITRCPKDHISTLTTHLHESFDFIRIYMRILENNYFDLVGSRKNIVLNGAKGCKRGDGKCTLLFNALAWAFWNTHISTYADEIIRVENMDQILMSVCNIINNDVKVQVQRVFNCSKDIFKMKKEVITANSLKRINHRIHSNYTLKDIEYLDPQLSQIIRHMSYNWLVIVFMINDGMVMVVDSRMLGSVNTLTTTGSASYSTMPMATLNPKLRDKQRKDYTDTKKLTSKVMYCLSLLLDLCHDGHGVSISHLVISNLLGHLPFKKSLTLLFQPPIHVKGLRDRRTTYHSYLDSSRNRLKQMRKLTNMNVDLKFNFRLDWEVQEQLVKIFILKIPKLKGRQKEYSPSALRSQEVISRVNITEMRVIRTCAISLFDDPNHKTNWKAYWKQDLTNFINFTKPEAIINHSINI
eukprot:gene143-238_t